jgi:hypothetical protein
MPSAELAPGNTITRVDGVADAGTAVSDNTTNRTKILRIDFLPS